MDDRRTIAHELDAMQHLLKELEIRYEQYFAGIERREPAADRKALTRKVRHFTNRHIVWTDLQFRYQGLASRFMSYCQYWDRILRLMDEGKYHRHTAKRQRKPSLAQQPEGGSAPSREADQLYQQMLQARKNCGLAGEGPSPEKIASFLASQREQIRSRYGDKPVEFSVGIHEGKPRIKVRFKD
jgi:hypothetical protein